MTIDSTLAKIGRSIKKWEIIALTSWGRCLACCLRRCRCIGRRPGRARRRGGGDLDRLDGVIQSCRLDALDDDPVGRGQASPGRGSAISARLRLEDHAGAVVEQLAELHVT